MNLSSIGSSIGAATVEAGLWQVASRIAALDAALSAPTGRVVDDVAAGGRSVTIAATLPVTWAIVGGRPQLSATDWLSAPFTPGGDLAADSWPGALLELAARLQGNEGEGATVQLTADADAGTVAIAVTLPITRTISSAGAIVLTAGAGATLITAAVFDAISVVAGVVQVSGGFVVVVPERVPSGVPLGVYEAIVVSDGAILTAGGFVVVDETLIPAGVDPAIYDQIVVSPSGAVVTAGDRVVTQ